MGEGREKKGRKQTTQNKRNMSGGESAGEEEEEDGKKGGWGKKLQNTRGTFFLVKGTKEGEAQLSCVVQKRNHQKRGQGF